MCLQQAFASRVELKMKSKKANNDSVSGYSIKQGDTLSSIAQKTGVSVSDILKLNPGLKDPKKIQADQVIRMPENAIRTKDVEGYISGSMLHMRTGVRDYNTNELWDNYQK